MNVGDRVGRLGVGLRHFHSSAGSSRGEGWKSHHRTLLERRQRGRPVTAAGLRSLFRHHRVRSRIPHANPHRLRHTFGAIWCGPGCPCLPCNSLMGHSQSGPPALRRLAPQDVWREYACAIEKRKALDSSHLS